jgi:hypothetical protein
LEGEKMNSSGNKSCVKLFSIIVISIIITGGFASFFAGFQYVNASTIWMEDTDSDFKNGTLNSIKIVGVGSAAQLNLINISSSSNLTYGWSELLPQTKPKARSGYSMAAVDSTEKVVMFGGDYCLGYTWIYNLTNNSWTKKTSIPNPGDYKSEHSMATIYNTDKVLLFGGWNENQTWIYDLSDNKWTNQMLSHAPDYNVGDSISNIWGSDNILFFGGNGGDQTWIYNSSANAWKLLWPKPNPSPSIRRYHSMAPIYNTDKVVLYGGYSLSTSNFLSDTWIFDLSDKKWTNMNPIKSANQRMESALSLINGIDEVLLFGGRTGTTFPGNLNNETWVYDLSDNNWSLKNLSILPEVRTNHTLTTIYGTSNIFLYGGYSPKGIRQFLNDTWILNPLSNYSIGYYISKSFDTGGNSSFKNLSWNSIVPKNTTLYIQLRTGLTNSALNNKNFTGPDGKNSSFYSVSPTSIWSGHYGDQWVQYKVYFTSNTNTTPILYNVSVIYNNLPKVLLLTPTDDQALANNKPTFNWEFSDNELDTQLAFQLIIDDNKNFTSIDFDSTQQNSDNETWTFPNGTGYTSIYDGKWYWKVRVKDTDNDWGQYSAPYTLTIDTKKPTSSLINPTNNTVLKSLDSISGIANDNVGGTGILKVEVAIKNQNNNKYWNGTSWEASKQFLLASGTTSWTYDSKSVIWDPDANYIIYSQAIDDVNNVQSQIVQRFITIDQVRPSSAITSPTNNSLLNILDSIAGTAIDTGAAGLNRIEINIKRESDGKSWGGSTWISSETWLTVTGSNIWSFDTKSVNWLSGEQFNISSRATDDVGNIEIPEEYIIFKIDLDAPSSSIDEPINNVWLNKLIEISGQAFDTGGALIDKIEISIRRESENKYWSGNDWINDETWLIAEGTDSWSYDSSNIIWLTQESYNIRSRAIDYVNNIETPGQGITFYIDKNTPSSNIIFPESNTILNGLTEIYGDSVDMGGAGINAVEIIIKDLSTDHYWDGEKWSEDEIWLIAQGQNLWSYDTSSIKWNTDTNYIVQVKGTDNAGNMEISSPGINFMYDKKPPQYSVSINNGQEVTNSRYIMLKINCYDSGSGPKLMSFSSDKIAWSPWEIYMETKMYNLTSGDGQKNIYLKIADKADNIGDFAFDSIILDTNPPYELSMIINDNAEYMNTTLVHLQISAKDLVSGVDEMAFSTDGETWTNWEKFSNEKQFTISSINGEKTIHLRISDKAGNFAVTSEKIILDAKPPHSLLILIDNGATETNSKLVVLTVDAKDEFSGVHLMSFSNDGISWSNWQTFHTTTNHLLTAEEGNKQIFFKVIDNAGNIAEPISNVINYKVQKPDQETDSDNDGVIDRDDDFPNDIAASADSDKDGSPDAWNPGKEAKDSETKLHLDKFPTDPAASIDTDNDNYPDSWNIGKSKKDSTSGLEIDKYPDNPDKYKDIKTEEQTIFGLSLVLVIIILFIIISLILVIAIFAFMKVKKPKRRSSKYPNDKILDQIIEQILEDKIPFDSDLTNIEIIKKLEENYKQGEISESTYSSIKATIENDER